MYYTIELLDFSLHGSAWEAKEYDTSVGKAMLENQFAKIPVCDQENPLRFPGDGKHIFIGKIRGIMVGDSGNVMSELLHPRSRGGLTSL